MTTHLRHPNKYKQVLGYRHRLSVTLCNRAATSNPFVHSLDIGDYTDPPRWLRFGVAPQRFCKRCLKVLAKGVLYLDSEGATCLVKHPVEQGG